MRSNEMLSIEEIARATGGIATGVTEPRFAVTGVSTDSRTVKPGQAFFALAGSRFDGHTFIDHAFKNGARIVVVSSPPPHPAGPKGMVPTILVPDTLEALGDLAYHWRRKFSCRIIAITGTNGKTTTKNLVAQVLAEKFPVIKTEGNFNNLIGLPLTVLKLRPHHRVGVFELGMNVRGEIGRLAEICSPEIGVITNIGPAHLAGLGSLAEIAEAKFELLRYLKSDGWAVLNYDDPLIRKGMKLTQAEVLTFGLSPKANVHARAIELGAFRTAFKVDTGLFRLRLLGIHNIYNALAAIACGRLFDVSGSRQRHALWTAQPEKLRTQILEKSGILIINDTYNANPESVRAALATLDLFKNRRKIVVLGGMLELGDDSDRLHQAVAREACKSADQVVFVGSEAEAYDNGKKKARYFKGKGAALRFLRGILRRGDVVLIKGSRATGMDEIVKRLERD
jgi:UDP-N-acetylmuramoyl-tripeptide--D-alanyl-D-alanine ligase